MVDERVDRADSRDLPSAPVIVVNEDGKSPYLFVCEHASNFIPKNFGGLGLDTEALTAHIAWDPGAVEVARHLSTALDATLIEAGLSRLLIDCNRPLDAHDLIPEISEATVIPGNHALDSIDRMARIDLSHRPFHACIESTIKARAAHGQPSWIVTIHSFTPVYHGTSRPWQIGIIHDRDDRIARPLIAGLKRDPALNVGVNEPYSPADRVYYTLERHARPHNSPCVMIEIRNDEITNAQTQEGWAARLAAIFTDIAGTLAPQDHFTGQKA
ncbi:N-formylglutamate amidohydrolase [Falsochrobactrum sp. TDYN1]|uniref:N-formylglutamate amidohydrolase n=1 Tax=Falsochrobactrum tianjinense TaxID=2706015 RepID=A0A949PME8_9HYPH|nr:N-formylglutamate amidohydrolase [Falsochrobactrum sp. TDYN1]MBV2143358.1 N-formylglutamate amidohydrolase [Falsochrobactrum sp. TDYN1]